MTENREQQRAALEARQQQILQRLSEIQPPLLDDHGPDGHGPDDLHYEEREDLTAELRKIDADLAGF